MIRRARHDERAALSDLAVRSKAYWGYDGAFMAACRDELRVTAAHIDGPLGVWVIEVEGVAHGFHGLEVLGGGRAELEFLFVDPEAIGTGLGRRLMEHAIAVARDAGMTELIIQGDPNAAAFYRSAGAVEIGRRPSASIPGRQLPLFRIEL